MAMREQRVQAVDQLVDSRFDWAHAFHELGRVLPPGRVSLTSLTGTIGASTGSYGRRRTAAGASKAASATTARRAGREYLGRGGRELHRRSCHDGSSATSATPPGSVPTFTLTGCATSQAEVALTLTRLRLIDGVNEVTLQSSTQSAKTAAGGSGAQRRSAPAPRLHDADHLRSAADRFRDEPRQPRERRPATAHRSTTSTGGTR